MRIGQTKLGFEDAAEFCRIFLTATPLTDNDIRLGLIDEIRASTIKEVRCSPAKRWIVLSAFKLFRKAKASA